MAFVEGHPHSSFFSQPPENPPVIRRKGNYQPTVWDNHFLASLTPHLAGSEASVEQRIGELKEKVKSMFSSVNDPLHKMNFVDDIDRLGLAYHFDKEIQESLQQIYEGGDVYDDLHAVALRFRLLRQQGYYVSCDVFNKFKDNEGRFMQSLRNDVKGLLSLYEASYLSLRDEDKLNEALDFTRKHLKSICNHVDQVIASHVEHALELPLHKRMPRLETRYYISYYKKNKERNMVLLELATLDFNLIQSLHQSEIRDLSRWWKDIDLAVEFPFVRDHVVECYTWGVDINYLPQFSVGRKALTRCINLLSLIDDTYDIYGTLEELELFTDAVDRWDLGAMDQLPNYMKLLYVSIYNAINDIEYISMRKRGHSSIYYLRKSLGDLCKAYMKEARWYYSGYVPTMEEYLNGAITSTGGIVIMLGSALSMGDLVPKEALDYIVKCSKLVWLSCAVCRFTNDLGTAKDEQERGDVAKSIQCYMKEHSVSEEEARECIKKLNVETWKDINQELLKPSPLPKPLIKGIINFGRVSEMYYKGDRDGHGSSARWTNDYLNSMYFEPISM